MKLERRRVTFGAPDAAHAQREWPERFSVLVRVSDSLGRTGVGEASPLPGYGRDTLEDAEVALGALTVEKVERALEHETARAVLLAAAELLPVGTPAARFALQTALLDLLGQQRGMSAPALLGAERTATRPLSALIGKAADPEVLERGARAVSSGYSCLKLKLGAPDQLDRELTHLGELRRRVGSAIALRLDANGSLTRAELERAWPRLEAARIELFEEPGEVPPALRDRVPLALDESLQGLGVAEAEAHLRASRARAAVLKPTALGGIEHCWQLAERAGAADAVISHCFDGPFAWRAAAALALALPGTAAHGLSPHAGLASWAVTGEACVHDGSLRAWSAPGLGLSGGFD